MAERWKSVVGFEGLYEVSDLGRVRSLRWNRVLRVGRPNRYCAVSLAYGGTHKTRAVHVLVLEAFRGRRPPGKQAAHQDGDRSNNRLANLRWKTCKANHADKRRHGTQCQGESHGHAKLTRHALVVARRLRRRGLPDVRIGKLLGVHSGTIGRALSGKTWAHV